MVSAVGLSATRPSSGVASVVAREVWEEMIERERYDNTLDAKGVFVWVKVCGWVGVGVCVFVLFG